MPKKVKLVTNMPSHRKSSLFEATQSSGDYDPTPSAMAVETGTIVTSAIDLV